MGSQTPWHWSRVCDRISRSELTGHSSLSDQPYVSTRPHCLHPREGRGTDAGLLLSTDFARPRRVQLTGTSEAWGLLTPVWWGVRKGSL